ncbi:MAG: GNAT family N-acetyltransferase [Cypionkella sp.]
MIRPATHDDAPAIALIMNRVIRETTITVTSVEKSDAEVVAMINDRRGLGHQVFVADLGAVVGYATYAQFRPSPGYVRTMEHSVALSDAGQGRGLGRALMAAIEAHATAAGAHVMIGAITADNAQSIRFHQVLGYVQAGFLPQVGYKFGRYHDLVLMQKILS